MIVDVKKSGDTKIVTFRECHQGGKYDINMLSSNIVFLMSFTNK